MKEKTTIISSSGLRHQARQRETVSSSSALAMKASWMFLDQSSSLSPKKEALAGHF